MKDKRIVVILQARMGATRLFGKPLLKVFDKPLLSYEIERLKRVKQADQILVATTQLSQDDVICDLAKKENVEVYRGSSEDVLDRYFQAATQFKADIVVRVTGDCPLIDPRVVDEIIDAFIAHQPNCDYASNTLTLSYPRGLDVEVFSYEALKIAKNNAFDPDEKEHVTPFLYTHPEKFRLVNISSPINYSNHRWTVDTESDLILIEKILKTLYPQKPRFLMQDVINLIDMNPDWIHINAHISQKSWKKTPLSG